jgi:tripartite-type tricarboxylate transporter receptor subunit TctC
MLTLSRRHILRLAGAAAVASAPALTARAQAYPSRPLKLIVPYAPGTPLDVLARSVCDRLSPRLGQPVVIDNRPGAGTTIGTKAAASANPDGYTLLAIGLAFTYMPLHFPDIGIDPGKSFAPVALFGGSPLVLVVTPDLPVDSVQSLVAYAKANPGRLNIGFSLGTIAQLSSEYFKVVTGTDINSIPYRGGVQAITDLLGGRVQLNIGTPATLLPLIKEGKLKPLAFTGTARSAELPQVPTMIESGYPSLTFTFWEGVVAPSGTPAAIIDKLNHEINESLKSPELQASFAKLGVDPQILSPQDFASFLAAETDKWSPIIKAANIRAE